MKEMPLLWCLSVILSCNTISAQDRAGLKTAVVGRVLIRGNLRLSEREIKSSIGTRRGRLFDPAQIDKDVRTLYAAAHFEDVKALAEDGTDGGKIVTFELREWPLIATASYEGLDSEMESMLKAELKRRGIDFSAGSEYNPAKANESARAIKNFLEVHGYSVAKVTPEIQQVGFQEIAVSFTVEDVGRPVASIEFIGNRHVSSEELIGFLRYVKVGEKLHAEELKVDLDRLRALIYSDRGYLRTTFGEPEVQDFPEGLNIVVRVHEGRRYATGNIIIEDAKLFTNQEISEMIGLRTGALLKGTTIQQGMGRLKQEYGRYGYIQFDAGLNNPEWRDSAVDPDEGIADLTFSISEGPQFLIGQIVFENNTLTNEDALRQAFGVNEGSVFVQALVDAGRNRINDLGLYAPLLPEHLKVQNNRYVQEYDQPQGQRLVNIIIPLRPKDESEK
jgi:outer membrane protein insertion porin family